MKAINKNITFPIMGIIQEDAQIKFDELYISKLFKESEILKELHNEWVRIIRYLKRLSLYYRVSLSNNLLNQYEEKQREREKELISFIEKNDIMLSTIDDDIIKYCDFSTSNRAKSNTYRKYLSLHKQYLFVSNTINKSKTNEDVIEFKEWLSIQREEIKNKFLSTMDKTENKKENLEFIKVVSEHCGKDTKSTKPNYKHLYNQAPYKVMVTGQDRNKPQQLYFNNGGPGKALYDKSKSKGSPKPNVKKDNDCAAIYCNLSTKEQKDKLKKVNNGKNNFDAFKNLFCCEIIPYPSQRGYNPNREDRNFFKCVIDLDKVFLKKGEDTKYGKLSFLVTERELNNYLYKADEICGFTISFDKWPNGKVKGTIAINLKWNVEEKENNNIAIGMDINQDNYVFSDGFNNTYTIDKDFLLDKNPIEKENGTLQKAINRYEELGNEIDKLKSEKGDPCEIKKLSRRRKNIINSAVKKVTNVIVGMMIENNIEVLVLEDLNITKMIEKRMKGKGATNKIKAAQNKKQLGSNMGYRLDFLKGKLSENNIKYLEKNPKNTSRKCHSCGRINENLKYQVKTWVCIGCGMEHNRDENAARNLIASVKEKEIVKTNIFSYLKKKERKEEKHIKAEEQFERSYGG